MVVGQGYLEICYNFHANLLADQIKKISISIQKQCNSIELYWHQEMLQSSHSFWSRYDITVYKALSNEDDNDDEDDDDDDKNDDVYRKNIVNENDFMPLGEFQLWIHFVLRDDRKTTTLHPNAYTVYTCICGVSACATQQT